MTTKVETKIAKPSGQPFPLVGTNYAHSVITGLVEAAGEAIDDEEERDDMLDDGRLLRGVVEHRDHLHAQVGELQATATRFQLSAREQATKYAGAMARMMGQPESACPIVEGDPMRESWEEGWNDAEAFACRVKDGQR